MGSVAKGVTSVLGAALVVVSCGSPAPTTPPAPTPLPTPIATPTPTPTPTPEPEPTPNTNRPVRLNLGLYSIEDPQGNFYPPTDPTIPIGWTARIDVTARDENNEVTFGRGRVEFFVNNQAIVRITGNQSHQRRLIALLPGALDVWAIQDGVRSNTVYLNFR